MGITLYALYSDSDSAQRAVAALRKAKVSERQITVVSNEPFDELDFGPHGTKSAMPWLAALGGVLGGTSGYSLAALTQRAYPLPTGGMPIVTAWTNGIITYELAMLGAYTKIDLFTQLENCALLEDSYLTARFLVPYFPAAIAGGFALEIPRHRLRRELIVTRLVNELVDLMGASFVFRLARSHGARTEQTVRGWLFAEGVLDLVDQADGLRAGGGLDAQAELAGLMALAEAGERACGWAISGLDASISLGDAIARYKPGFQSLCAKFEAMLADDERERFERGYRELRATVHTEQLALRLARLGFADHLLNVLSLSFVHGGAPADCARAYFALSGIIEFATLERALEAIGADDRWERRAAEDLAADLRSARLALCRAVLLKRDAAHAEAVRALRIGREHEFDAMAEVMTELRTLPAVGLPVLEVAIRTLTRLAAALDRQPRR
jgi:glutamate dehydrogenase